MNRSIRRIHVGSALVLLISLPLATGARAAVSLPPVLTQALQAMAAAHSYTITDSTISTNSFGTTSSSDVITVVRQGKVLEMSLVGKDRLEDGTTSFTAMVIGAKHTCIRRNGQGAWNCSLPSMGYLLTSATSFTSPATKTGHGTWAPAGNRIIRGQDCAGFNETYTTSTLREHGTFWLSIADKLPVQDTTYTKRNASKATTTTVWSNWNDPSLTIPNVGA